MAKPIRHARGVNRSALHLLWTIPVASLISLPLAFLATISLCGISGCSGGGFGATTDDEPLTWIFVVVIGVIFVVAVASPGWLYPRTMRLGVAIAVGLCVTGLLTLDYVSQLQELPH